ncbi:MAG: molybdate ABC transporter permease subunit, partial [Ilumatobacteraceae bacterium]
MTTRQITDRNPRGFVVAAGVGVALVALPLVGLLAKVEWSRFVSLLGESVVRDALWLSIVSSIFATLLAGLCGIT